MNNKISNFFITSAMVAALMLPTPIVAAEVESLGAFDSWYAAKGVSPDECWTLVRPITGETQNFRGGVKVEGVDRGDETGFYVIFTKDAQPYDATLAFTGGNYSFDTGKPITLETDGKEFIFNAQNNEDGRGWAWTTPENDKILIPILKAGRDFKITSESSRGTMSIDTFSLVGFTSSYKAAKSACE